MNEAKVIHSLALWIDPVARSGPEAMAVDEWLLQQAKEPVLRIYDWSGEWISFGYFDSLANAQSSFQGPELQYVRRWTGGGVVDHRCDWTYTLILPRGEPLAETRGAESYARIHHALANALMREELHSTVLHADSGNGAAACFQNPVKFDLADPCGQKLAGAGQRRTKWGLLHQGSVAHAARSPEKSALRAQRLASALATKTHSYQPQLHHEAILTLATNRYMSLDWIRKRP